MVGVSRRLLLVALVAMASLASAVKLDSAVTAWKLVGNALYLGTESGGVFKYLIDDDRLEPIWQLPQISLVTGKVQPKIYSLDYKNGSLLWVRDGPGGYRVVEEMTPGGRPRVVVPAELELPIVAAWYTGDGGLLLVLLDGQVLWTDENGNAAKKLAVTRSAIGATAYNGKVLAVGDEGGVVTLVDVAGKQVVGSHSLQQDKVLSLALGKQLLVSGGRDRRAAALDLETGNVTKLKAQFFVMTVAIDPTETLVAYNYDEGGTIRIVDLKARREVLKKEGFAGLNKIAFYGEDTLIVTDDMGNLQTWRWK